MYAFICACVCRHTDCAFNINNRQACNWLHWTPTNMTYCDSDFLPLRQKAWKITLKEETFVSSHSFRDVCPRLASSIECRHVPREMHYGLGAWQKKHYSLHGSQEEEKEREEGRETKHVLQRHGIHDIFLPATTYLLTPTISPKCHQIMNHQLIHNWLGQSSYGTNTSPKLCLWALPWGSRL